MIYSIQASYSIYFAFENDFVFTAEQLCRLHALCDLYSETGRFLWSFSSRVGKDSDNNVVRLYPEEYTGKYIIEYNTDIGECSREDVIKFRESAKKTVPQITEAVEMILGSKDISHYINKF
ncbi:MAG: hypothetical protein K5668_06595 [Lachnospiraceae bacterium]|nr:hypothetical protein [Lachnospiraceae bacterium]